MGWANRWIQQNIDGRRHPAWRPPAPTARSIARHAASNAYTAGARVEIDAKPVLDWMERLKMEYLGRAGVRKIVREEMVRVRAEVQNEAKGAMKKDPRKAYKAVQMLLYKGAPKSVFGGNVNILRPKKNENTRMAVWSLMRKRGKIRRRRKRSDKTNQMDGYMGKSRYFVLHWIDAGAKRAKRGVMSPTNFFTRSAGQGMKTASANVREKVGALIKRQ